MIKEYVVAIYRGYNKLINPLSIKYIKSETELDAANLALETEFSHWDDFWSYADKYNIELRLIELLGR